MFGILAFVLRVLSSHQKVEHGVAVYLLFKPVILVVSEGRPGSGRDGDQTPLRLLRRINRT